MHPPLRVLRHRLRLAVDLDRRAVEGVSEMLLVAPPDIDTLRLHSRGCAISRVTIDNLDSSFYLHKHLQGEIVGRNKGGGVTKRFRDACSYLHYFRQALLAAEKGELIVTVPPGVRCRRGTEECGKNKPANFAVVGRGPYLTARWVELRDGALDKVYYYNPESLETTWRKPDSAGFRSHGGGKGGRGLSLLLVRVHYHLGNCVDGAVNFIGCPSGDRMRPGEPMAAGITMVQGKAQTHKRRPPHMFTYAPPSGSGIVGGCNGARSWFPCIDRLRQRCEFKVEVTVCRNLLAVCSGRLTEKIVYQAHDQAPSSWNGIGGCGDAQARSATYCFYLTTPVAPWCIGVAVGPFQALQDPQVPWITHFCLPDVAQKGGDQNDGQNNALSTATRAGIMQHTTRHLHVALRAMEAYLSLPFPYASHKQVFVGNAGYAASGYASISILSDTLLHGPSTHAQDASVIGDGISIGRRRLLPASSARSVTEAAIYDPRIAQAQAAATAWFGGLIGVAHWSDAWLQARYTLQLFSVTLWLRSVDF